MLSPLHPDFRSNSIFFEKYGSIAEGVAGQRGIYLRNSEGNITSRKLPCRPIVDYDKAYALHAHSPEQEQAIMQTFIPLISGNQLFDKAKDSLDDTKKLRQTGVGNTGFCMGSMTMDFVQAAEGLAIAPPTSAVVSRQKAFCTNPYKNQSSDQYVISIKNILTKMSFHQEYTATRHLIDKDTLNQLALSMLDHHALFSEMSRSNGAFSTKGVSEPMRITLHSLTQEWVLLRLREVAEYMSTKTDESWMQMAIADVAALITNGDYAVFPMCDQIMRTFVLYTLLMHTRRLEAAISSKQATGDPFVVTLDAECRSGLKGPASMVKYKDIFDHVPLTPMDLVRRLTHQPDAYFVIAYASTTTKLANTPKSIVDAYTEKHTAAKSKTIYDATHAVVRNVLLTLHKKSRPDTHPADVLYAYAATAVADFVKRNIRPRLNTLLHLVSSLVPNKLSHYSLTFGFLDDLLLVEQLVKKNMTLDAADVAQVRAMVEMGIMDQVGRSVAFLARDDSDVFYRKNVDYDTVSLDTSVPFNPHVKKDKAMERIIRDVLGLGDKYVQFLKAIKHDHLPIPKPHVAPREPLVMIDTVENLYRLCDPDFYVCFMLHRLAYHPNWGAMAAEMIVNPTKEALAELPRLLHTITCDQIEAWLPHIASVANDLHAKITIPPVHTTSAELSERLVTTLVAGRYDAPRHPMRPLSTNIYNAVPRMANDAMNTLLIRLLVAYSRRLCDDKASFDQLLGEHYQPRLNILTLASIVSGRFFNQHDATHSAYISLDRKFNAYTAAAGVYAMRPTVESLVKQAQLLGEKIVNGRTMTVHIEKLPRDRRVMTLTARLCSVSPFDVVWSENLDVLWLFMPTMDRRGRYLKISEHTMKMATDGACIYTLSLDVPAQDGFEGSYLLSVGNPRIGYLKRMVHIDIMHTCVRTGSLYEEKNNYFGAAAWTHKHVQNYGWFSSTTQTPYASTMLPDSATFWESKSTKALQKFWGDSLVGMDTLYGSFFAERDFLYRTADASLVSAVVHQFFEFMAQTAWNGVLPVGYKLSTARDLIVHMVKRMSPSDLSTDFVFAFWMQLLAMERTGAVQTLLERLEKANAGRMIDGVNMNNECKQRFVAYYGGDRIRDGLFTHAIVVATPAPSYKPATITMTPVACATDLSIKGYDDKEIIGSEPEEEEEEEEGPTDVTDNSLIDGTVPEFAQAIEPPLSPSSSVPPQPFTFTQAATDLGNYVMNIFADERDEYEVLDDLISTTDSYFNIGENRTAAKLQLFIKDLDTQIRKAVEQPLAADEAKKTYQTSVIDKALNEKKLLTKMLVDMLDDTMNQ